MWDSFTQYYRVMVNLICIWLRMNYSLAENVIQWSTVKLPPTNEVWGKVMFLHLWVILFTGLGASACREVSASRGCLPPGAGVCPRGEVCIRRGGGCGRYASYWNTFLFYGQSEYFVFAKERWLLWEWQISEIFMAHVTKFLTLYIEWL